MIVPGRWTTVWSFPFQSNEVGTALKSIRLKHQMDPIPHPFVAVGTATVLGIPIRVFVSEWSLRRGLSDNGTHFVV